MLRSTKGAACRQSRRKLANVGGCSVHVLRVFLGTLAVFGALGCLQAQEPALKERPIAPADVIQVDPGTRIFLSMINSVSTKQALVGDQLRLETAFPVIVNQKIVVPQGSWVTGTVTDVRRGGRGVKARHSELEVRFDSLTLPNGVTRHFKGDLGGLDAASAGTLDREHEKVKGPGDGGSVVRATVAGAAAGTGIGALATRTSGSLKGPMIGLGVGAAAGLIAVLATRGPDAVLPRGSSVEMVLDRPLIYDAGELDFSGAPPRGPAVTQAPPAVPQPNRWTKAPPF